MKNPNSPSRIGANLSLDHLKTPEFESSNFVFVIEKDKSEDSSVVKEENENDRQNILVLCNCLLSSLFFRLAGKPQRPTCF